MVANVVAGVVVAAIAVSAIRYLINRHLVAKRTGRPVSCCGCSADKCCCGSVCSTDKK